MTHRNRKKREEMSRSVDMGDRNKLTLALQGTLARNCHLYGNAAWQGWRAQVFCTSFWDCGCVCPWAFFVWATD